MTVLLDTTVLCRLANAADPNFRVAESAIAELYRLGHVPYVTPQNFVEFRDVATRPAAVNGLGLSPAEASAEAARFEAAFPMLDETPAVYPAWRTLADAAGVVGKQVHDARLVAVCHTHGVPAILTFNVRHFTRFAPYAPGITVLDPATF